MSFRPMVLGVDIGIIDATARIVGAETLRDVLTQNRLKEVHDVTSGAALDDALDDVVLALPIPEPEKILCAGRNYRAYHEVVEQQQMPDYPSIFGRFASSFSAHRQAILKPRAGDQLDYEGELVVVIGKAGRHVSKESAFDHVAGYTCMNEGTVRDWMGKGTPTFRRKTSTARVALGRSWLPPTKFSTQRLCVSSPAATGASCRTAAPSR